MSRLAKLLIAAALLALTACHGAVKPDLPHTIIQPSIVYVDRYVYVPIKAALTQQQPIAEGPLSQCPDVAAARKASLRKANAQLGAIEAVQGTPAKP